MAGRKLAGLARLAALLGVPDTGAHLSDSRIHSAPCMRACSSACGRVLVFRFQVSGRPARGTSTAGGGPRKRGAPNRHRAAYSVPPSRVEAGGPWQHPAPPGADTCRFQGGGGSAFGVGGAVGVYLPCGSFFLGGGAGGQRGDVHRRSGAPRRGAVRGRYSGVLLGIVLGCNGCAASQCGALLGRSMGLHRGRGAARD